MTKKNDPIEAARRARGAVEYLAVRWRGRLVLGPRAQTAIATWIATGRFGTKLSEPSGKIEESGRHDQEVTP